MRKWLLVLSVCLALGLVVAVWLGVEDARQAALLDARIRAAENRADQTERWKFRLVRDGAPMEEVVQAYQEDKEAWKEMQTLRTERWRRQQSWHVRLRQEVRRRTGW